jgi:hypothetical protein
MHSGRHDHPGTSNRQLGKENIKEQAPAFVNCRGFYLITAESLFQQRLELAGSTLTQNHVRGLVP